MNHALEQAKQLLHGSPGDEDDCYFNPGLNAEQYRAAVATLEAEVMQAFNNFHKATGKQQINVEVEYVEVTYAGSYARKFLPSKAIAHSEALDGLNLVQQINAT